jgi:hypothetical protein
MTKAKLDKLEERKAEILEEAQKVTEQVNQANQIAQQGRERLLVLQGKLDITVEDIEEASPAKKDK